MCVVVFVLGFLFLCFLRLFGFVLCLSCVWCFVCFVLCVLCLVPCVVSCVSLMRARHERASRTGSSPYTTDTLLQGSNQTLWKRNDVFSEWGAFTSMMKVASVRPADSRRNNERI